MSEAFLKRAVKKHFKALGYTVSMRRIRLGNAEIDGEAYGPCEGQVAIEIKTANDDICRGIGQLAEATAFGYDKAVLVTTLRNAQRIDGTIFKKYNWILLGIDSKSNVLNVIS